MKIAILLIISISILFTQSAFASNVEIGEGSIMTIGSGSTVIINNDATNTLINKGTLNVEDTAVLEIQNNADMTNDCTGTTNVSSSGQINIGSSLNAILTNHGTINGPGTITLFGIDLIQVDNSGNLAGGIIIDPLSAIMQILSPCSSDESQSIGGNILPIDNVSLMIGGVSSSLLWILPVAFAGAGVGVILVRRRF